MTQTVQQALANALWNSSGADSDRAGEIIDILKDNGFVLVDITQFKKAHDATAQMLQPGAEPLRDWFAGQALALLMREGHGFSCGSSPRRFQSRR